MRWHRRLKSTQFNGKIDKSIVITPIVSEVVLLMTQATLTHCLLFRAIEAGDLLDPVKKTLENQGFFVLP